MMKVTMQQEIISIETIKPSSPTPHHLRTFKLSLLDQNCATSYVPILIFYPSIELGSKGAQQQHNIFEKSTRLKKSLSETLTHYYPFAGRIIIKDNLSIDCNDEGVEFYEARIKCELLEVLKHPELDAFGVFFPTGVQWADSTIDGVILSVQVSYFDCGGMAIAVCISHKVADAASLSTFMNDWAITTRLSDRKVTIMAPQFTAAALFPPNDGNGMPTNNKRELVEGGKFVTRRYVIDGSNIASLKAMAIGSGVENPTRVQVATALVMKCITSAQKNLVGFVIPTRFSQSVNLRKRMTPSLPDNSIGNLVWRLLVKVTTEKEIEFGGLVKKLKSEIGRINNMEAVTSDEVGKWISMYYRETEKKVDFFKIVCTSWCNFPIYQVDFGWGKPIWYTYYYPLMNCMVVLMDTRKGDGVEVILGLEEQHMAAFEREGDIIAFASPNPSVLDT